MTHQKLSHIAREEVAATLAELPARVRAAVREVPVFLERVPTRSDLADGVAPDTLGFFDDGAQGIPTPRIRLWLDNLWDYAEADEDIFREEVRTTLLHEIGHFLGWDEDDLDERGLG